MRVSNRENDVLSGCLSYLELMRVFAWRQNQGAIPLPGGGYRRFVGLKGVSDILGILPRRVEVVGQAGPLTFGNLLAVETKKAGGKLRPEQEAFLAKVNDLGGVGICVHSIEELQERLRRYL